MMLLSEAIDIFLKESDLADRTKENYRRSLDLFNKFYKNNLEDLKPLDVLRFHQSNLSTKVLRYNSIIALKSLLNFFNNFYDFPCLKSEKIKFKRPQTTSIKHVTEEFLMGLIDNIKGDGITDIRNRALLHTMYCTGARSEELTKIKIKDVDFVNSEVLLHGKGEKDRTVFINDKCAKRLQEYLSIRHDRVPWLFMNHSNNHSKNKQLSTSALKKLLSRLSPTERFSPHRVRKTTAKKIYLTEKDLIATQHYLGQAKVTTTQNYLNVDQMEMRDQFDKSFGNGTEWNFDIKKNNRAVYKMKIWAAEGYDAKAAGLSAKAAINKTI